MQAQEITRRKSTRKVPGSILNDNMIVMRGKYYKSSKEWNFLFPTCGFTFPAVDNMSKKPLSLWPNPSLL